MNIAHVYIINRKQDVDRRKRVWKRIHSIFEEKDVTFIEAKDNPEEIKKYTHLPISHTPLSVGVGGCLLSHLEVLHQFGEDFPQGDSSALILEDDVLLHLNFNKILQEDLFPLFSLQIPNILLLSSYCSSWNHVDEKEVLPSGKYKCMRIPAQGGIWSTAGYFICSSYAREVLKGRYHIPIVNWKDWSSIPHLTSEFLILASSGYFVWPPIVMEESVDSHVTEITRAKFDYWQQFGLKNFVDHNDEVLRMWKEKKYPIQEVEHYLGHSSFLSVIKTFSSNWCL